MEERLGPLIARSACRTRDNECRWSYETLRPSLRCAPRAARRRSLESTGQPFRDRLTSRRTMFVADGCSSPVRSTAKVLIGSVIGSPTAAVVPAWCSRMVAAGLAVVSAAVAVLAISPASAVADSTRGIVFERVGVRSTGRQRTAAPRFCWPMTLIRRTIQRTVRRSRFGEGGPSTAAFGSCALTARVRTG